MIQKFFKKIISTFKFNNALDIVFILPPKNTKGWILDGIIFEISSRLPKNTSFAVVNCDSVIPKAKKYFFSHYMFYLLLKSNRHIRFMKKYIWFTHLEPEKHGISNESLFSQLKNVTKIICMNSNDVNNLSNNGIDKNKLCFVIGGADHKIFVNQNKITRRNNVGFVSRFYERKNPLLIYRIIKYMKDTNFILLGKEWEKFELFKNLQSFNNFKYMDVDYTEYPRIYNQMQVIVSPSLIEGGPIPLIEAMMCGVIPVASDTGFAKDIIKHGENGFIFKLDQDISEITTYIKESLKIEYNSAESSLKYSWDNFAKNIFIEIGLKPQ